MNFVLTFLPCRHIIETLQQENATVASQNKHLDSENKILLEETEKLKEVCKVMDSLLSGREHISLRNSVS